MDNQAEIQKKVEFELKTQINELYDRMSAVEYALYKTEEPDTRFTEIYDKLSHVEMTRAKDVEANAHLREQLDSKFDDTLFKVNSQIQSLETYHSKYEGLVQRMHEIHKNIEEYMEQMKLRVSQYFRRTDEQNMKMGEELEQSRDM